MNLRSWTLALATLPWLAACATEDPEPNRGPPSSADGTEAELRFVAGPAPEPKTCTCTRRPEGTPSRNCPWGTGASASALVGAAGGAVELRGTSSTNHAGVPAVAKLDAGALAESVQLKLTELTTPPPAGFVDWSPIYKLEPFELQLAKPGEISLPGSNIGGPLPRSVALYRASSLDEPFERVADSYQNAGFYQAPLLRGGYYFVGAPAADVVCPDEPAPASPVTISECPCTRRGKAATSPCEAGTGTSSSEMLGTEGGEVSISGTPSTVGVAASATIQGTALAARTTITLTELKADPPEGFVDYSPVYKLEPLTLTLQAPSEISLPWGNKDGFVPDALAIYYAPSADEPFRRLPDSYTNAGFEQATLAHGGYYFVGYPSSLLPPGMCQ